ncbi:MAG: hypothetical protein ACRCW1_05465 [Anaerotignaceae bacterium]
MQKVVAKKVDFTNPMAVLNQLGEINNVSATAAECEAMMEFLNDKLAMKKLAVLDMETRGAAEKKIILNNEIGSTNFYLTLIRLLIKEMHHSSSRLITALSYLKQEMKSL